MGLRRAQTQAGAVGALHLDLGRWVCQGRRRRLGHLDKTSRGRGSLLRQPLLFEIAGREPSLLSDVAIRSCPGERDGLIPQGLRNPFGGVRSLLPPVSKLGGDMVELGDGGVRDW